MSERSARAYPLIAETVVFGLASLWMVLGISRLFADFRHPEYTLRWAAGTEILFLGKMGLVLCLSHLSKAYFQETAPVRLHLQDYVTVARGFAVSCMGGFIFLPNTPEGLQWVPCLLYLSGIAGDILDGYLARNFGGPTRFGAILDSEFDSAATLLGAVLAIISGRLPLWYMAVGLAHYIFFAGIWWRKRSGLPVNQLPASNCRRVIGGASSLFLALGISPALPPETIRLLSLPFMFLVMVSFISDWHSITRVARQARKIAT